MSEPTNSAKSRLAGIIRTPPPQMYTYVFDTFSKVSVSSIGGSPPPFLFLLGEGGQRSVKGAVRIESSVVSRREISPAFPSLSHPSSSSFLSSSSSISNEARRTWTSYNSSPIVFCRGCCCCCWGGGGGKQKRRGAQVTRAAH